MVIIKLKKSINHEKIATNKKLLISVSKRQKHSLFSYGCSYTYLFVGPCKTATTDSKGVSFFAILWNAFFFSRKMMVG